MKMRDDLSSGVRSLHIARAGHKGRHVVIFRILDEETIEILRLLHDSMDFSKHIR
jgi:toxin ParE1/3/4